MNTPVNNQLAVDTWEEIGAWWDEQMLEGDTFHSHLVHPYMLQQLKLMKNDTVVDLACGNGGLTRKIASQLAKPILGIDCSSTLLAGAVQREKDLAIKNEYLQLDLMNDMALNQLSVKGKFTKAVCSMALQDIENIAPLINTVKNILSDNGKFVVSIPHPCFNSGAMNFQLNDEEKTGILRSTYASPVKLLVYAKENQPKPHPHFHRPLNNFLQVFFDADFGLTALDEPIFTKEQLQQLPKDFLWSKFPEIPPVMILTFEKKR